MKMEFGQLSSKIEKISLCPLSLGPNRHKRMVSGLPIEHIPPFKPPPPPSLSSPHSPPPPPHSMAEPPSFNTPCLDHHPKFNTAIVIAALLCALLCALGLYSMLQCVVQCTQRAFTQPAVWVASRKMNSGLKKKELIALPTCTYSNSSTSTSPMHSSPNCAICLVDFADGEKIRVLPECDHRFHVACVDKWLLNHSFCPTCRHYLKSSGCVPCLQIVTVL